MRLFPPTPEAPGLAKLQALQAFGGSGGDAGNSGTGTGSALQSGSLPAAPLPSSSSGANNATTTAVIDA